MLIKNIFGKKINVFCQPLAIDEEKEFLDDFKKTNEFKILKQQKYIAEVEKTNVGKDNSKE